MEARAAAEERALLATLDEGMLEWVVIITGIDSVPVFV